MGRALAPPPRPTRDPVAALPRASDVSLFLSPCLVSWWIHIYLYLVLLSHTFIVDNLVLVPQFISPLINQSSRPSALFYLLSYLPTYLPSIIPT